MRYFNPLRSFIDQMKRSSTLLLALVYFIISPVFAQETNTKVEFTPSKLNFGSKNVDACTPGKKIKAKNVSDIDISNPQFSIEGGKEFSIQSTFRKCPDPLKPGQVCSIYINFCPPLYQKYEATLVFSGSTQTVPMVGRGRTSGGR
jgi:hypothetical protein